MSFTLGQRYEETWRIDEDVVQRFADLSGDQNPVHMNADAARAYGFPRRVAHGALSIALLSRLIGMRIPGPGALWLGHHIEWRSPVFVGDELRMSVEVKHFSEAAGILQLSFHGANQRGDTVLEGEARVKVNSKLTRQMENSGPSIALITGGSRGIGAAIARRLAKTGCKVAINYRSDGNAAETISEQIRNEGGTCLTVQADVSKPSNVSTLLERVSTELGPPDVIIHGATPALVSKRVIETELTDVDQYIQTYVGGALALIRGASGTMIEKKYGRFVFLGTAALFGPPPSGFCPYLVGKSALWGLVRIAAQELGPLGITVNMVSPGLTITDLTGDLPSRVKEIEVRKVAVRRLATVDDTAALVTFLISPEAGYINGANLPLTGGPI